METCTENFDSGQLKEKEKEEKEIEINARQSRFSPFHPKITPKKIDAAQLVPGRDVVDDEVVIDNSVARPQESDYEVFALTDVSVLPR